MQLAGVRIGIGLTVPIVQFRKSSRKLNGLSRKERFVPILSPAVLATDTRFGKAEELQKTLITITGRKPWHSLVEVEPIGQKLLM